MFFDNSVVFEVDDHLKKSLKHFFFFKKKGALGSLEKKILM